MLVLIRHQSLSFGSTRCSSEMIFDQFLHIFYIMPFDFKYYSLQFRKFGVTRESQKKIHFQKGTLFGYLRAWSGRIVNIRHTCDRFMTGQNSLWNYKDASVYRYHHQVLTFDSTYSGSFEIHFNYFRIFLKYIFAASIMFGITRQCSDSFGNIFKKSLNKIPASHFDKKSQR